MEKNKQATGSSPLASPVGVLLWLVLGVVCTVAGYRLLAGAFAFLFLLGGSAARWGRRAMTGVSVEVCCDRQQLFPGEETELRYTVKNDKLLPLVWLELSQNAPDRDCLVPGGGFEEYSYLDPQEEGAEPIRAYRRTFSFVMGYETLTLSSRWQARRRGLYRPRQLLLRSGDGFGLTQLEHSAPGERLPELVVYPRPVAVDVSLFLHSLQMRISSAMGLAEDPSVLRGLRPYQTTDSWKRINWRMAARQPGELKVNFFETVQPVTVHFILDGESFCSLEEPGPSEALEEALEVLASVIRELFRRGIVCGLSLPVSRRFPAVDLPPAEGRSAAELLYYLAGYEPRTEGAPAGEGQPPRELLPSRFDIPGTLAAAGAAGMTGIITQNPKGLPSRLTERLDGDVTVFSAGNCRSGDSRLRVLPLSRLRKGGSL